MEGTVERKLIMNFNTAQAKTYNMLVNNARADMSSEEVKTTMMGIIVANIFSEEAGDVTERKAANLIETITKELIVRD